MRCTRCRMQIQCRQLAQVVFHLSSIHNGSQRQDRLRLNRRAKTICRYHSQRWRIHRLSGFHTYHRKYTRLVVRSPSGICIHDTDLYTMGQQKLNRRAMTSCIKRSHLLLHIDHLSSSYSHFRKRTQYHLLAQVVSRPSCTHICT